MFDFFITETLWLYLIFIEHEWLFTMFHFLTSTTAFAIFTYHQSRFRDLDYYLKFITQLYDFSNSRYRSYKALFTIFLPLAMFVIVWSFRERFNSNKFLRRFG